MLDVIRQFAFIVNRIERYELFSYFIQIVVPRAFRQVALINEHNDDDDDDDDEPSL